MSTDVKSVGELLRDARNALNLSIESIAKDICVRSSYLVAIEENNYAELPEKTFAVGFVRAYAMALKLDAKLVVARFKDEFEVEEASPTTTREASNPRGRKLPGWLSPAVGVLGVSLCWALFGGTVVPFSLTAEHEVVERHLDVAQLKAVQATLPETPVEQPTEETRQVSSTQPVSEIVDENVSEFVVSHSIFSAAAIADQNEVLSAGRSDVTLTATEDAWVRLENVDGTEIWSGVLREGQSYRPELEGQALLSTTNAGGVALSFAAGEFLALGNRGEVVEDLRLDSERLFSTTSLTEAEATGSR